MKHVLAATLLALAGTAHAANALDGLTHDQCNALAQLAFDGAQMRDDGATLTQAKAGVYVGAQNAHFSDRVKDVLMDVVTLTYRDSEFRFNSPSMIGGNVYGSCMAMHAAHK